MIRDPGHNNPGKESASHSLGIFWMGEGGWGQVGAGHTNFFLKLAGRRPAVPGNPPGSAELLASLGFLNKQVNKETLAPFCSAQAGVFLQLPDLLCFSWC